MNYIKNESSGYVQLVDSKIDNLSCILYTESEDVIENVKSDNYILNMQYFNKVKEETINNEYEKYIKVNKLPEIQSPKYASYIEKTDKDGNTYMEGTGDIILGVEDLKNNRKYSIIQEKILPLISIEINGNNFYDYFIEKPKSELEILKEQFNNEVATRKLLEKQLQEEQKNNSLLTHAMLDLANSISSIDNDTK